MKFLKGLGITVLAVVILYLVIAIFSSTTYSVTRELAVDVSKEAVWEQISTFEKWEAWSPWKEKDSTLLSTYEGTPGEVGSKVSWVGDPDLSGGTGSMTITEIIPNQRLAYTLNFPEWEMTSEGYIAIETTEEGGSKITWNDSGDMPFIMRPTALIGYFDKMMGPDFERGLANIGEHAENYKPIAINEVEVAAAMYFGKRHHTTIEAIMNPEFYSSNYGAIAGALAGNEDKIAGAPVAIYYAWDEEAGTTEVALAFPVSDSTLSFEGMELIQLPAQKAVKAVYQGPYEGSPSAHYALGAYTKEKAIKVGLVMEEYLNDPRTVSSPEELLTNIYYFVID